MFTRFTMLSLDLNMTATSDWFPLPHDWVANGRLQCLNGVLLMDVHQTHRNTVDYSRKRLRLNLVMASICQSVF